MASEWAILKGIMNAQMHVAAHVRQLKTFIIQLLLDYVGRKVSRSHLGPYSMLTSSLRAVAHLQRNNGHMCRNLQLVLSSILMPAPHPCARSTA